MNQNIKSILRQTAALLLAVIIFVQCNKKDAVVIPTDTLATKLAADPQLSIFTKALTQVRLETFTKGAGPFTVLAPTNTALTAAGITEASLASIDTITLTAFLLNHFQSIKRTSFEFPIGPNTPMTSIAGFSNYSYKNAALNATYVNASKLTEINIDCSNGMIHKIDKVLDLPVTPMRTIIKNNPNYSLMDSAISKAGLTTTFAPGSGSATTVFLINNASMIAAGYSSFTAIGALTPAQVTTLSNILKYHVVQSRNFSVAFKAGNLKTVLGSNLVVTSGTSVTVKGLSNPSPFTFLVPDILASNGVMHEINGMFLP